MSAIGAFLLRIKRKNTPLLLIIKRRTTTVFTLRDSSKGDGRSLHYGLSAPPTAVQAFETQCWRGGKLADIAIVVNRCVDILLPNRRDLAKNDWLLTGAEGASMSGNYAIDVWP